GAASLWISILLIRTPAIVRTFDPSRYACDCESFFTNPSSAIVASSRLTELLLKSSSDAISLTRWVGFSAVKLFRIREAFFTERNVSDRLIFFSIVISLAGKRFLFLGSVY